MGDISDYYRDLDLENQYQYSNRVCKNYNDNDFSVWTTKAGVRIKVCNMTDSHLINSLNMINKSAPNNELWFDALANECIRRKLKYPEKSPYFECDATVCDIY